MLEPIDSCISHEMVFDCVLLLRTITTFCASSLISAVSDAYFSICFKLEHNIKQDIHSESLMPSFLLSSFLT